MHTRDREWKDGLLIKERVTETSALDAFHGQLVAKEALDQSAADAVCVVLKAEDEQRYTLGLAYPAMRPDVGVAMDGFRDFVGVAALEATAWQYMTKSRNVGLWHADGIEGRGTVVESYIYRGPDWSTAAVDGSAQVIKAGDWMLGTVWDEPAWALVKAGFVNGYSPMGTARRAVPDADRLSQLRSA